MLVALLKAIVTMVTIFHCLTYLLWRFDGRRRGVSRPREAFLPLLTSWIGEGMALLLVVLAWPAGLVGQPRLRRSGNQRPVVLVHGWSLNRASMALLAARLRRDGRDAYAVNYPSLLADTDAKAAHLADTLRRVAIETGSTRIDVIAHSLGGVVIRAVACRHGGLEFLGNVVTLGSPHGGCALAVLLDGLGLRQLRPGSRYLERLAGDDTLATSVNVAAVASTFDAVAFPIDCCEYRGALNISIDSIGHHGLLMSEQVYTLAKENLDVALKGAADERQRAN